MCVPYIEPRGVAAWEKLAMPMPSLSSMDDAEVIVSAYEELPRRRRSTSHGASSTAATRAKTRAAPNASTPRHLAGYNRRALLLAYAQQLRRRRVWFQQSGATPLLEWGSWKQTDPVDVGAGGDDVAIVRRTGRRRSWCSRLRSCVRLWISACRRRVMRIRESASCKKLRKGTKQVVNVM
ncbi:hypothetical protein EJB05_04964, partial [Eragrostis curvula]